MEPTEIMTSLFDNKILNIIKFFLKNDSNDYYLREIGRSTKVSAASTYRILNKLVVLNVLDFKEIKTAKLYRLSNNKTVEFLRSIVEVDVIDYFIESVSKILNIEEILLLGKQEKTKANVLILGDNINSGELKLLVAEIKEKYDFTINQMVLSRIQYEQMSAMGLYPGGKKVLFRPA